MELFKLLGTIAVDNAAANKALQETSQEGEKAESKLSKTFGAIGKGAAVVGKTVAAGLVAGATACAGLATAAIKSYADYEQLVGGVETLFGTRGAKSVEEYAQLVGKSVKDVESEFGMLQEAQSNVMQNAANAYKTAGLSANAYMETASGLAAALNQSSGSQVESARLADQAIIDMADNSAKMGTTMESIQTAYAGFSKQNYTMLDNLKLGYGGTKEEMERLLADAEKISGIKYDISSFSDVTEAIHVMQVEMGIAGTTAAEASGTIQGSLGMLKGAWSNLMTGLSDPEADLSTLINNVFTSVTTFASNLVPRISQVLSGIATALSQLVPMITAEIPGLFNQILPPLIEGAVALVDGLVSALPGVISAIQSVLPDLIAGLQTIFVGVVEAIIAALPLVIQAFLGIGDALIGALPNIINAIVTALPTLINQLVTAFTGLIMRLVEALPQIIQPIIDNLPTLIDSIVRTIIINLPVLIAGVVELINGLVAALPQVIQLIMDALPQILEQIGGVLVANLPILIEAAISLVMAIISAIPQIIQGLVEAIPTIISLLTEALLMNLPVIILGLIQVVVGIVAALPQIFMSLIQAVPLALAGVWDGITNVFGNLGEFFTNIFSGVAGIFKTAWEGIKGIVSSVLGAIVNVISTIWNSIKNTISGVLNGIKSVITTVWNAIKTAISTVVNAIKSVITTVWNGIKTAITTVINAIKTVITTVWNGIKSTITTVLNAIKSVVSTVWNGIKSAISTVVNAIKTTISNVFNSIKTTVSNIFNSVKSTVSNVWNSIKSAISNAVSNILSKVKTGFNNVKDAVVNAFTGLPAKMLSIGKNLVEGIWNGISNAKDWVLGKIKGFGKSIVNGIKGIFGIKSPSRVMRDEVGRELARGIAVGVESEMGAVGDKIAAAASETIDVTKRAISDADISGALASSMVEDDMKKTVENAYKILTTYNELTLADEVAYWDAVRVLFAEGTEDRIEYDAKYFDAKKKMAAEEEKLEADRLKKIGDYQKEQDEIFKGSIKRADEALETKKIYQDISLADEVGYWDVIRQQYEEGTDLRIEADKKYFAAKKNLDEKILDAEKELQDDLEAIYKNVADKKEKYLNNFSLFEEYTEGNSKPANYLEMNEALDSQIAALEMYDKEMEALEEKIGGTALYDEIAAMGIKGLSQVQQFNKLNDYQIQQYLTKYNKRDQLAGRMAKEDTADETMKATVEAYQKFAKTCDTLGVEIEGATGDMAGWVDMAFDMMKDSASSTASEISFFTGVLATSINSAMESIKNAMDSFKEGFKMPHFKVEGTLDVNTGSVPEIAVDWYSKAMSNARILSNPTIFGYSASSGKLLGGGEAGNEVVAGEQTLLNMIQTAVAEQNSALVNVLTKILRAIQSIDGNMYSRIREALESMSFDINNREFARLVKAVK